MDREALKTRLKELIVERLFLNVKPQEIPDDVPLTDEYKVDSVAIFELVVGLEEEFGFTIAEEEFSLDLFETVNSLADFVERKLAATSQG